MGGSTSASAMPSTSITLGLNSIALRVALRYRLSLLRSACGQPECRDVDRGGLVPGRVRVAGRSRI